MWALNPRWFFLKCFHKTNIRGMTSIKNIVPKEVPLKELNDGTKIPMLGLCTHDQIDPTQKILRPIKKVLSSVPPLTDKSMMRESIRWAVMAGYRHIDSDDAYRNQVQLGHGINDVITDKLVNREELFITAKLPYHKHNPGQVVPALRDSLSKLNLLYVDLYLIQTPYTLKMDWKLRRKHMDIVDTWKGMEKAKELGLTRSIGVSNFSIDQITRIVVNSKIVPSVNQIEVNPTHNRNSLIEHCQKMGIAVVAHTPFGFMVNRNNFQMATAPPPRFDDPSLVGIASKYKKTPAQVVLRYLIDRGTIPLPQATTKDHLLENIDVFDFKLNSDEMDIINNFNRDFGVYIWQ